MVGHSRGLLAFVTYAALVRRPKTNVDHRITPLKATNDILSPKGRNNLFTKNDIPAPILASSRTTCDNSLFVKKCAFLNRQRQESLADSCEG